MTSMHGDIVNRVKRLPKPSQAAEALQPVFEAVSNSLHAVEDAFGDQYLERGKITVTITNAQSADDIEIVIEDNGVGLEPARFEAFCTTDTDYKISRGGKGVGRLLWLDAFESIKVESIYRDKETLYRRSFTFHLTRQEQILNERIEPLVGVAQTGTTVTFKRLRGTAYRDKFPHKTSTIIKHFGSHFFADFIMGQSPTVTVDIDANVVTFPEEILKLRVEDRGITKIESKEFGTLSLRSFVCEKAASANFEGFHQMHLVANGRTVTTRKIDGLIGIGYFGPSRSYVYHGCITGNFLDERVNQERTQFNFVESIIEEIVRECSKNVQKNALGEEITQFNNQRLETMHEFIQEYPSFAFEDARDLLARTPNNAVKPEQFAQALIPVRIRRDKERNDRIQKIVSQLGENDDVPVNFQETVRKAADEIRAEEQRQLTEYVLRRKTVLDVMEVLTRRIRERDVGSLDFHLEETLHQFICPMKLRGDDPSKVEVADHDLWIIDERLTFTKYFASDVSFKKILDKEASKKRPDLLIYDRLYGLRSEGNDPLQRVMLVEFKHPGRKDYDERYSPMNQISEYITKLQNGDILDFRGGHIRVAPDCIFYCYVVADIVGKLEIQTNGWRTTANGRGRIQELSGKFRGIVEIIEWADLLNDARLRNQAFISAAGLRYDKHT